MEEQIESKEKENENQTKPKKIIFFEKIWYSITKIDKYKDMISEGIFSAIKYFILFMFLLGLILGIVATIIEKPESDKIFTFLCGYTIGYFITLIVLYAFYVILISICCWLIDKIFKIKEKFKYWFMSTIYASTTSSIIYITYLLIRYFTKFSIPNFDMISMMIIYIYLTIIIIKKRKERK